MAFGTCRDCHQPISWDEQKRKQYNTRRPLNLDGTIHSCSGTEVQPQSSQQHFTPSPNPPKVVIDQDQRSQDIKAAQIQRKKEHDQLIRNMQWLTKMLAFKAEQDGGGPAKDILNSMGFEEFQEEQRSFEDDTL